MYPEIVSIAIPGNQASTEEGEGRTIEVEDLKNYVNSRARACNKHIYYASRETFDPMFDHSSHSHSLTQSVKVESQIDTIPQTNTFNAPNTSDALESKLKNSTLVKSGVDSK
jgi:hypothetical protein